MEENTQLPKEVVNKIIDEAYDKYNLPSEAVQREAYQVGATAYATKLHQANETIKVLEYDNNRLKGEVEGLRTAGDEASAYIEFLDVQNNRLRKMLSDICEKAGAGTEIEKMIVEFFKEINTERESAAGREDEKRQRIMGTISFAEEVLVWAEKNGYNWKGFAYWKGGVKHPLREIYNKVYVEKRAGEMLPNVVQTVKEAEEFLNELKVKTKQQKEK